VLDGIRILDLTRMLAGPYATMILADLGAEVIKIEPPDGDDIRRVGPPFVNGESAYFLAVNRGKKSVVLDLTTERDRARFDKLAATADVVIDNFRPGVLSSLGIDHPRLRTLNPKLVCCSLTSFGETGPMADLPAFDLILQAFSGAMSVTGEPGRPPVRLGIPLGDLAGGSYAAIAVLAALVKRGKTGEGSRIELSLLDCLVAMTTYLAQYHFADGRVPGPQGSAHMSCVPYGAYRARDGHIVVGVFTERFWPGFCTALGQPDWITRYGTNADRLARRDEVDAAIQTTLATNSVEHWCARLRIERVPAAPVLSLDRALALEQLALRGMITSYDHPTAGTVRTLADPILRRPARPSPQLGEHNRELL
jgi:crotonobetainyl-CoA:carnitine CoA-transferase CaiB-like acyl-CoA transferase